MSFACSSPAGGMLFGVSGLLLLLLLFYTIRLVGCYFISCFPFRFVFAVGCHVFEFCVFYHRLEALFFLLLFGVNGLLLLLFTTV